MAQGITCAMHADSMPRWMASRGRCWNHSAVWWVLSLNWYLLDFISGWHRALLVQCMRTLCQDEWRHEAVVETTTSSGEWRVILKHAKILKLFSIYWWQNINFLYFCCWYFIHGMHQYWYIMFTIPKGNDVDVSFNISNMKYKWILYI